MDEGKLRAQQTEGERSKAVLDRLEDAFEALERDCFDSFRNSDVHDDDGRTMCRLYLKVMDDVKARFTAAVRTGEAARKELARMEEESKLKRVLHGRR